MKTLKHILKHKAFEYYSDLESPNRELLPACDRKEFRASFSDCDLVAIFPCEADKAVCSVKGKNLNDQSFCVPVIAGPALYRADWEEEP